MICIVLVIIAILIFKYVLGYGGGADDGGDVLPGYGPGGAVIPENSNTTDPTNDTNITNDTNVTNGTNSSNETLPTNDTNSSSRILFNFVLHKLIH